MAYTGLMNYLEDGIMELNVLFHDGDGWAGFKAFCAGVVEAPQVAGPEFLKTGS